MKTHLWSTQPFLKLRYPRKWGCRGDLQDNFIKIWRKKLCFQLNVNGYNFLCVGIQIVSSNFKLNCIMIGENLIPPAWNSTFFGFPKPATLAKMISPEDWTPWFEVTITPQRIKWEILMMNFYCLTYLSKKNTLHVKHQGLCQPCRYIKVLFVAFMIVA